MLTRKMVICLPRVVLDEENDKCSPGEFSVKTMGESRSFGSMVTSLPANVIVNRCDSIVITVGGVTSTWHCPDRHASTLVASVAGGSDVLVEVGGPFDADSEAVAGEPPLGGAMSWWVGAHAASAAASPIATAVLTCRPRPKLAGGAVRRETAVRLTNPHPPGRRMLSARKTRWS